MDKIDEFLDMCEEYGDDLLYPTDLKEAIVGTVTHFSIGTVILLDKDKCIQIFCERDGMTYEEAIEHFEFNVLGAYVDGVPAYATFIEGIFDN